MATILSRARLIGHLFKKKSWFFTNFLTYFIVVNVISRKTIVQFYTKHAGSKEALETWFKVCKHASWSNFNEVRKAYPTADVVGDDRMVFNIKGNNYRLIARFSFRFKTIQVKWIGTHREYDSIDVLEV